MIQIFFITLLVVAISFFLLSIWFKKPLLGVFAGTLFILLGVICLQGVTVYQGAKEVANYTYNSSLTSSIVTVTTVNTVTDKDVTSFLVYGIIGLALLLMSAVEMWNINNQVNDNSGVDDE